MLLIDSADPAQLLKALAHPAVSGCTTNPTLFARAAGVDALPAGEYLRRTHQLCRTVSSLRLPHRTEPRVLMLQGVGATEDILALGRVWTEALVGTPWQLWVKLPPTEEGLATIAPLKARHIATLVTAIYTTPQAYLACEAGADGLAVYVGRLQRSAPEWPGILAAIRSVTRTYGRRLLLASLPDLSTVEAALAHSADLTLPPQLLPELLASRDSEAALAEFSSRIVRPG